MNPGVPCTAAEERATQVSHNATRSFSYSPYALLLLIVEHQMFMSMNRKSVAAGPRDKKAPVSSVRFMC